MYSIARTYRYVLRKGSSGHEIWALQLNLSTAGLPLEHDGVFGVKTEKAVKAFQAGHDLKIDGVAGAVTQRQLCAMLLPPIEKIYNLPPGLIYGLAEGESGFMVGCVNFSVVGGADLGYFQRRVLETSWTSDNLEVAFSARASADRTAAELRAAHDRYVAGGVKNAKDAWLFAVLRHNWPAAADQYAAGTIDKWRFTESWVDADGRHTARLRMDEPARWIARVGATGVRTGFDWVKFYLASKTGYVTAWPK